jgi:hypothetical protein
LGKLEKGGKFLPPFLFCWPRPEIFRKAACLSCAFILIQDIASALHRGPPRFAELGASFRRLVVWCINAKPGWRSKPFRFDKIPPRQSGFALF